MLCLFFLVFPCSICVRASLQTNRFISGPHLSHWEWERDYMLKRTKSKLCKLWAETRDFSTHGAWEESPWHSQWEGTLLMFFWEAWKQNEGIWIKKAIVQRTPPRGKARCVWGGLRNKWVKQWVKLTATSRNEREKTVYCHQSNGTSLVSQWQRIRLQCRRFS